MKSNRVYTAPPILEDLGTGRSYYNFDISQSEKQDEEGGKTVLNYDYSQVAVLNPASYSKIIQALTDEGYYITGQKTRLKAMVLADCQTLNIPIDQ